MIEIELLNLMLGCVALTDIVGKRITPYHTDKVNSLFYNVTPLSSDGTKERYRLETTAIFEDDYKALQVREELKKLFITIGDTPLTENILKCVQNGGSKPIFNGTNNTYTIKTIFEMIRRA